MSRPLWGPTRVEKSWGRGELEERSSAVAKGWVEAKSLHLLTVSRALPARGCWRRAERMVSRRLRRAVAGSRRAGLTERECYMAWGQEPRNLAICRNQAS
jgi:hypothetical protein